MSQMLNKFVNFVANDFKPDETHNYRTVTIDYQLQKTTIYNETNHEYVT